MDRRLLELYDRELAYLRDMGAEFAREFPKVAGRLDRTVRPGEKAALSAAGSTDPDGEKLTYRWWQYDDVDTATTKIRIANATSESGAGFVVPNEPGRTIHIILEATDDGDPPLTRYQRIIFTIAK